MQVTLTNDYHSTEAVARPVAITQGRYVGLHKISKKTAIRLRRELCGSAGCTCGGNFGERGGARIAVVSQDHDGNYIIDLNASNAQ